MSDTKQEVKKEVPASIDSDQLADFLSGVATEIVERISNKGMSPRTKKILLSVLTPLAIAIIGFFGSNLNTNIGATVEESTAIALDAQFGERFDNLSNELDEFQAERDKWRAANGGFNQADRDLLTSMHKASVGYHEESTVTAFSGLTSYSETTDHINFWHTQNPVWSSSIQSALLSVDSEAGRERMSVALPSYQYNALIDWYYTVKESGDE